MVAVPQNAPRGVPKVRPRPGVDLISTLIDDGAYGAALTLLAPRLRPDAGDPVALDQAATCHWQLEQGAQALAYLDRLVTGWPQLGAPCVKLASYAAGMGQVPRAKRALDRAFARGVRSAQAMSLLNRLDPIARDSAMARRLKAMARDTSLPKLDQAIARNTLGKIEERAGRYRAAFRWFESAKRAYGKAYHPRQISALVAGQILKYHPITRHGPEASGPRLLFITGMPRSGTTVLEHSLSRHSQIRALGESPALSRTVMALRRQAGQPGAWDWFDRVHTLDRAAFRQLFLSFLPAEAREDDRLLVSKMPLDCFDLGVAAWLWPDARVVHLDRHPMDVGLSNFTTLFHQGHDFSRRLDWAGHMIRAVDRSITDYAQKLGPMIRRQSYSALVAEPEAQLRAILDHANLPWEEACLTPQSSDRPVQTASMGQLAPGFTSQGIDRWQRYDGHLDPLLRALDPDWVAAFEARDRGVQRQRATR